MGAVPTADDASPATPLIVLQLRHGPLEHTLYLKDERVNPTGSIKDRTARALVDAARTSGWLDSGRGLVESTSGNLGAAIAREAAGLGVRFRAITDPNLSPDLADKIRSYGGEIEVVRDCDHAGNYLGARLERARADAATGEWVWTNQYSSDAASRVHVEHTGPELLAQLPAGFDELLVAVSTCGTLAGLGRLVRAASPSCRVVAVDVEGSSVFGRAPARRVITGIGSARCPDFELTDCYDEVEVASEAVAISTCLSLSRTTGIGVGPSTGAVVAACLRRLAHARTPLRAVAFVADGADNYRRTIYDPGWRRANGFEAERLRTEPSLSAGNGVDGGTPGRQLLLR